MSETCEKCGGELVHLEYRVTACPKEHIRRIEYRSDPSHAWTLLKETTGLDGTVPICGLCGKNPSTIWTPPNLSSCDECAERTRRASYTASTPESKFGASDTTGKGE